MKKNNIKKLKLSVLNRLINILILDLADKYIEKLKNYKAGDAPEKILKYLDSAVYFSTKYLKLNDDINESNNEINLKSGLCVMSRSQKREFKRALKKSKDYKILFYQLNFIYCLFKYVELQEQIFHELYVKFINNENKEKLVSLKDEQYDYFYENAKKKLSFTKYNNFFNNRSVQCSNI